MYTKISLLALAIIVVACGSGSSDSDDGFNGNGQAQSGDTPPRQSFVVRTNQQTGQAEYAPANFDEKTHPQALANMAEGIRDWRPVQSNQVINSQKGYPSQGKKQLYFVRDPQSFSTQQAYPQTPTQYSGVDYRAPGTPSQLPSGPGYGNGNYPSQLPSGPGYGNMPNYGGNRPVDPNYGVPAPPGGQGGGGYPGVGYPGGGGGGYPPGAGGGYPPGGSGYPSSGPGYPQQGYYPYCGGGGYSNCYGYLPATYMNSWVYWSPTYYYPAQPYSYAFYSYAW